MRRLTTILMLTAAAACTDKRAATTATTPRPPVQLPAERGDLIGMTAEQLATRFGAPALQVREGASLKLQFRAPACILDAYLYRGQTGEGVLRVTHVDARDRSGRDVDQRACMAAFDAS